MSALEKFLMKAGGKAKGLLKGKEVLGPMGAVERTGYRDLMGPILKQRDEPERIGGLAGLFDDAGGNEAVGGAKKFAEDHPMATGAIGGAAGAGGLAALLGGGDEPDGDEDDEGKLKSLLHRMGI